MPFAIFRPGAAGASNTAALSMGGANASSPNPAKCNTWNGSAWTNVADLNLGRTDFPGSGTSTAAIAIGGIGTGSEFGQTEIWNGTVFTESSDLSLARRNTAASNSSSTASLAYGGSSPSILGRTEQWDAGVSIGAWFTQTALNSAREALDTIGTNTSALAFGGEIPPSGVTGNTEDWNGSTWAEINNLNTARRTLAGAGTSTAGLAFGGWGPSIYDNTETWNGLVWAEVNDLNTAR